jgi:hypothetical protein
METNWENVFQKTEQAFGGGHTSGPQPPNDHQGGFDVSAYLNHYGISHKVKGNGSKVIYALDRCVFDAAHTNNDAAIFQFPDGKLGYKCHHNSCMGKGWIQARQAISGEDNLRAFVTGGSKIYSGTGQKRTDPPPPRPVIELVTLGEIHNMEAHFPDPIIDGLLDPGDSLLFTGSTGLGKSLVTTATALAVAAGKRLFDKFPASGKHNVLLFQSENSLRATKTRLSALVDSFKDRADHQDYIGALDHIFTGIIGQDPRVAGDILDPGFAQDLADAIQATGADLLILDPLISYHTQDENDNGGMRKALDRLTQIVGEKTAVILTHHHGKGNHEGQNQARGASAILDWARGILTLTRQKHETKKLIRVDHTKAGNFGNASSFLLEVDGPCVFPVEADVLVPPSRAVEILQSIGGRADTKNAFVEAIISQCDVSRRTAQEGIDRASDMGLIRAIKKGRVYLYETI